MFRSDRKSNINYLPCLVVFCLVLLVGCQPVPLSRFVTIPEVNLTTTDLTADRAIDSSMQVTPESTDPEPTDPEPAEPELVIPEPVTPELVAPKVTQPPTVMQITALELSLEVVPMGWVVTESGGALTTEWIVPTNAVGWHVNSARAGAAGNLILSGHQTMGSAVFAPLALGDIVIGQEIELTDAVGETFLYRVTEVSEPVPILGATEEDKNMANSFMNTSEAPILTLMTGWPDFTTTHRIFAVAEYVERSGL